MVGKTFGPYKILEPLGAGGMGEVYLAEDTRLGRNVAVKVLPEQFAGDSERLARFEQEARAAAALNHAHIAAVFDVGCEDGVHFIVQELLQGSTLRELLDTERALSLDRALVVAVGVAEALAAAHRAGIVHRDLKPANIFVAPDDQAKVLDFGLAKLTEAWTSASGDADSPTALGTMAGTVMGTAGYMAPEQASGTEVDHRADVFAFGCVVQEMLTGQRAFQGRSTAEVISRLLHEPPSDMGELVPNAPLEVQRVVAELRRIVRKCLAKEPTRRYQHADDLALDLRELQRGEAGLPPLLPSAESAPARTGTGAWLATLAAAIVVSVLGTLALTRSEEAAHPVRHFELMDPGLLSSTNNRVLAISRDGRSIAYVGATGDGSGLMIRDLDTVGSRLLRDTGGSRSPSFSPDGGEVAFWAAGQIRRVATGGGPVVSLGPMAGRPLGVSWADDGFIYVGRGREGVWRVPATGGEPEQVIAVEEGEHAHGPQMLPGGEWMLLTIAARVNGWNDAQIVAIAPESGERRVLVDRGRDARWVPGYLTYVRDYLLFAEPFDIDAMVTTGEAISIAEGMQTSTLEITGAAFYSVSDNGVLVYDGGPGRNDSRMVWLDDDAEVPLPIQPAHFGQFRLSADEERVAAQVFDDGWHIWMYDVDRREGVRLTTAGSNRDPVWSRDGEWIYFGSDREGDLDIWRRRTDLTAAAERVYAAEGNQFPAGLGPDDAWLLFVNFDPGGSDVGRIMLDGDPQAEMLADSPADEARPSLSPDGRFFAYQSDVSGGFLVYVMEIASRRRMVATDSDSFWPIWMANGAGIFFREPARFAYVPVRTDPSFEADPAVAVNPRRLVGNVIFDVDSGGRILTLVPANAIDPREEGRRVNVVVNWPEAARQLSPAIGR